jgi:hypothetical protein
MTAAQDPNDGREPEGMALYGDEWKPLYADENGTLTFPADADEVAVLRAGWPSKSRAEASAPPPEWVAGFHSSVAAWLDRTLPERYPHAMWAKVDKVLSVEQSFEPAGWLSDVTPVDSHTSLCIDWVDVDGERQSIDASMLLTDLMKELT